MCLAQIRNAFPAGPPLRTRDPVHPLRLYTVDGEIFVTHAVQGMFRTASLQVRIGGHSFEFFEGL